MWPRILRESPRGSSSSVPVDWGSVLREHDRWLRTVVCARLREPEAVDEVMQEVALAAVRESAPLADPGKVAPWLYRVAVRQALMYRRKCGRRRKLVEQYTQRCTPVELHRGTPEPLDWLLAEERRKLVRRALAALPPRDAEILLLKYTENWDYHQIAERLDVSHSAVEARLHRARRRLRDALGKLEMSSQVSR
jgi:RNA polymerase sigma factor (sigma-70 family)